MLSLCPDTELKPYYNQLLSPLHAVRAAWTMQAPAGGTGSALAEVESREIQSSTFLRLYRSEGGVREPFHDVEEKLLR